MIETLRVGHLLDLRDFIKVCEEKLIRQITWPIQILQCVPIAWELDLPQLRDFLVARACFNAEFLDIGELDSFVAALPPAAVETLDAARAKNGMVPSRTVYYHSPTRTLVRPNKRQAQQKN